MAKTNTELFDKFEDVKKQFETDYEQLLNLFDTNLTEIKNKIDIDRSTKKTKFLEMIKKHLNIFFYPKNENKQIITMYANFGKEHDKVISIMKCGASLLFKEGTENKFANQIMLSNITNISAYLIYLLEFINNQFQLLSKYENVDKVSSPLTILDKKAKLALKDNSICINDEDDEEQINDIILKGLGNVGFISFPIKQLILKISFDLGNKIITYNCSKLQTRKLMNKDSSDGKKGQDCKELIKWIDTNKLNTNRTQYCVVPSQFSFSRNTLSDSSLTKRYKTDYEKKAKIYKELEKYMLSKNVKNININMKFAVSVVMNINIENNASSSDFDDFDDDEIVVTESEKQIQICQLHEEFVKKFKHLLDEDCMSSDIIIKPNSDIKAEIFNPYEKIMPNTSNTSSNNQPPLISSPKCDQSDDEISDASDE